MHNAENDTSQPRGFKNPPYLAKDFERVMIVKALQHTDCRRIEAANQLGMGRNTLTRKIQELDIKE